MFRGFFGHLGFPPVCIYSMGAQPFRLGFKPAMQWRRQRFNRRTVDVSVNRKSPTLTKKNRQGQTQKEQKTF
jgi:hypothetical protein